MGHTAGDEPATVHDTTTNGTDVLDAPDLGPVFPRPFDHANASFTQVLATLRGPEHDAGARTTAPLPHELHELLVDGTTVLALRHTGGVVIAGDRRATAGNLISKKDMRKVFPADRHSAVAISGSAGPAMDMARVFATELEHYEKIEGETLSLDGKSNKLAGMVRSHFPMAVQGLVVVPLFCGVDRRTGESGIFDYDPVGGRYRAADHACAGSGSLMARQTLKRMHDPDADAEQAVRLALEALLDAADDDSATGGPDRVRGLYPIVATISAEDGYQELDTDEIAQVAGALLDARSGLARGDARGA